VRTEQSFASHRRQIFDLIDNFGDAAEDEFAKQLVATRDDRTGDDSLFVDGQVRRLMEEFEDNEGRRYQHPPNRPNDREVVVVVPAALAVPVVEETEMLPGDQEIMDETATILASPELAQIREAHAKGEPIEVRIGSRALLYEPECQECGMTLFGEDGFIIGQGAFARAGELEKTLLHELRRLRMSQVRTDGATAAQVLEETKDAASFAERVFKLGRRQRRW